MYFGITEKERFFLSFSISVRAQARRRYLRLRGANENFSSKSPRPSWFLHFGITEKRLSTDSLFFYPRIVNRRMKYGFIPQPRISPQNPFAVLNGVFWYNRKGEVFPLLFLFPFAPKLYVGIYVGFSSYFLFFVLEIFLYAFCAMFFNEFPLCGINEMLSLINSYI